MTRHPIDGGQPIDWGRTSEAYAKYRPGYPDEFFDRLVTLGVGTPGQRVLDLGTGTGVLARAFAARGARVTGVDVSRAQIRMAKALTAEAGLEIDYLESKAEDIAFPPGCFDLVSAGQSWLYFDANALLPKVLDVLAPNGRLVLTHLLWLPQRDAIAQASEELVLKHNPSWSAANYDGVLPPMFDWALSTLKLECYHVMERRMPFTRDAWRGRFLACRGIGASLPSAQIEAFDKEHDALLRTLTGDSFSVLHQMTAHVYSPARTDPGRTTQHP